MNDDTRIELIDALVRVKSAVGVVQKLDRNEQGKGFNFRGVDAVVNACAPEFVREGIVVRPVDVTVISTDFITYGSNNTKGFRTVLAVTYEFSKGAGALRTTVTSEAIDSGDKSVAKAMSVAYRIALLQTLTLPTDERDPDHDSYETNDSAKNQARQQLFDALKVMDGDSASKKMFVTEAIGHAYDRFADLSDDDVKVALRVVLAANKTPITLAEES